MLDLSKILKFTELLNKFRQVQRRVLANGEDRYENDVEHSYQLAMLTLYIVNSQKLDFDHELILKYALIHDFVEVYAGDTYIYSTNMEEIDSKEKREKKAMQQLKMEFPEFSELHKIIEGYENKINKESKFIYSLDKIQPVLNVYTDGGRTFKKESVTLQMLIDHKQDKVAVSPEVKIYFDELTKLLKKEEKTLFNKL